MVGHIHAFICLALILLSATAAAAPEHAYSVIATRVSDAPLLCGNGSSSSFKYQYNPAAVDGRSALIVRCQTLDKKGGLTPSVLAWWTNSSSISNSSVVMSAKGREFAVEDPRIVLVADVYYMTYSAVTQPPGSSGLVAKLSLATSSTPEISGSWVRHGELFPALNWSKSGAMLPRADSSSVMLWGDSGQPPYDKGVYFATSRDLFKWDTHPSNLIIALRSAPYFDTHLIEGGPPPMRLSSGDYLALYNSARAGFPSNKPGYDLQYNCAYVILSGSDPTKVVQRSGVTALLSPVLRWEKDGLTPNVVFCEGMIRGPEPDTFIVYYGAADTCVGSAKITVKTK